MRFRLNDLQWQDRRSVAKCRECRIDGAEIALLCGWHENVVAASAAVARMVAKERKQ